jgi:hypothetical protein
VEGKGGEGELGGAVGSEEDGGGPEKKKLSSILKKF